MMMAEKLFAILIFFLNITVFNFVICSLSDPVVTVKQGQIKGTLNTLQDGSPYYSFKGIRYAEVPARFAAPVPTKPWEGIYDATKHGPVCPQFDLTLKSIIEGDEDCLFLNIYTKSLQNDSKLPVMVFIHGGAYLFGSGNSDSLGPEWLIQHDVILVTLNYRLEMLGFLCLDTPEVPGNAGLRDQAAALLWVKENIKQFGGDPTKVTLFGESAGSASVTFHIQSPVSKGLFQKAIVQSGVSIVDWAQGKNGKHRAFRAARYLGNNSTDTAEVLAFLRSVPATKLAGLTYKTMTYDESRRGLRIHFAPVVEKKFDGVESFITETPVDALVAGRLNKVSLLIGYNSDEGMLMMPEVSKKIDFYNKNPRYTVPREIAETLPENKEMEFGKRIRSFYLKDRDFTAEDTKIIIDLLTDTHFIYSIIRYAHFYSPLATTYLYKFRIDTELNILKKLVGCSDMPGAGHADELFYLFNNKLTKDIYDNDKELHNIVFRFTKLWTDFAKTGNPTPNNYHGALWPTYTPSSRAYVDIGKEFTSDKNPDKARVDFWNKLYCDSGRPCIPNSHL